MPRIVIDASNVIVGVFKDAEQGDAFARKSARHTLVGTAVTDAEVGQYWDATGRKVVDTPAVNTGVARMARTWDTFINKRVQLWRGYMADENLERALARYGYHQIAVAMNAALKAGSWSTLSDELAAGILDKVETTLLSETAAVRTALAASPPDIAAWIAQGTSGQTFSTLINRDGTVVSGVSITHVRLRGFLIPSDAEALVA